jgi:hypothetical protein
MILLIFPKVWQFVADIVSSAEMVFGPAQMLTYVNGVAGICVSNLPEGTLRNTLPLLWGPAATRPGPFSFAQSKFARLSNHITKIPRPVPGSGSRRTA